MAGGKNLKTDIALYTIESLPAGIREGAYVRVDGTRIVPLR